MKRRALVLGMILCVAANSAAFGQDDGDPGIDPARTGPYIAIGVGIAFENFDTKTNIPFAESAFSDISVGYRAGEYVSVEAEFEYVNGFDEDLTDDDEVNVWTTTVNVRVHLPLGRLEPFITYGGGVLKARGSGGVVGKFNKAGFVMKGGGGLEYHMTNEISLYGIATYAWPISGVEGFDYTSAGLGLLYKF